MKKLNWDNIINKVNYYITIGLFIAMPVMFLLKLFGQRLLHLNLSNLYFYKLLWLLIPIEVIIYIFKLCKRKFEVDIYDILMYILILLGLISTRYSIDIHDSIFGCAQRNEGLLSIVSYYLLFLNAKSINDSKLIKKIIKVFIIVSIIQVGYSFLQVFVRGVFTSTIFSFMASGFVGNPNFFGGYIVTALCLSLTLYFVNKEHEKFYFITSLIFFVGLVLAESTGPFYSFIAYLIFIIIFLKLKKIIDWSKTLKIFIATFSLFIIVSYSSKWVFTNIYHDGIIYRNLIIGDVLDTFHLFKPTEISNEIKKVKKDNIDSFGSGRLVIWKNSLPLIPRYFWTGSGLDNFVYVYPQETIPGAICDKAHNHYIQIAVTNGVPALMFYLLLLAMLFFKGISSKNKLVWSLLGGFVVYSIQIFMNISTVKVAPFYFIIMGLLAALINKDRQKVGS